MAFSNLVKRKEGRVSENAKGKQFKYEEYIIADYLCSNEENTSIEDKKWMFRCKVEDINIRGNQRYVEKSRYLLHFM